jgi:hypothetical protein
MRFLPAGTFVVALTPAHLLAQAVRGPARSNADVVSVGPVRARVSITRSADTREAP